MPSPEPILANYCINIISTTYIWQRETNRHLDKLKRCGIMTIITILSLHILLHIQTKIIGRTNHTRYNSDIYSDGSESVGTRTRNWRISHPDGTCCTKGTTSHPYHSLAKRNVREYPSESSSPTSPTRAIAKASRTGNAFPDVIYIALE